MNEAHGTVGCCPGHGGDGRIEKMVRLPCPAPIHRLLQFHWRAYASYNKSISLSTSDQQQTCSM
ncbi:unnamed protein product, partial [Heterotrigona itama]